MIFTRTLLEEFLDLSGITHEMIYAKLNSIGLEVDSSIEVVMPDNVVVGKVLECAKHPDADKLSVTTVDVGGGETKTIVCGARNIAKGQWVPVALVGAKLPGGLVIKEAELRGVDSHGMICSAEELGLSKVNDGILVLDESIGSLRCGLPLTEISLINDRIYEIELTPNRGDCLCLHGVCRELAVAFGLSIKKDELFTEDETVLGIGRVLQLHYEGKICSSLIYKAIEPISVTTPLKIQLILALRNALKSTPLENILEYATYVSGVVLHAYKHDIFHAHDNDDETPGVLTIKKDSHHLDAIYAGEKRLAIVGISQEPEFRPAPEDGRLLIEASYIAPEVVSEARSRQKLKTDDDLYFRTSRGSNPELDFGIDYTCKLLRRYSESKIYSGVHELTHEKTIRTLSINVDRIAALIGEVIDKSTIVNILSKLEFEVSVAPEDAIMVVKVPSFRHDIMREQDIAEEIVRIVGIDQVTSQPMRFAELCRFDEGYQRYRTRRDIREKAASCGFFETVHFLFDSKARNLELGLPVTDEAQELLNPITQELDTLRASLLPHMLQSAAKNLNVGYKKIAFFEQGSVYTASREEISKLAFLHVGPSAEESFANHGKPEPLDFYAFADRISRIVGAFECTALQSDGSTLWHPHASATMVIDGCRCGTIGYLHPATAEKFELDEALMCELDEEALRFALTKVVAYSAYQANLRDLSLLVQKQTPYAKIRQSVTGLKIAELERFYPLDIYFSDELGEMMSLTLRFHLQSPERTLTEEEMGHIMEKILHCLREEHGAVLR